LDEEEYKETIENLTLMAKELKADISIICERKIEDSTSICTTTIDKGKQYSLESTGNSSKGKVLTKKNLITSNKVPKQQLKKDNKVTSSSISAISSLSLSSSSSSSTTTTTATTTTEAITATSSSTKIEDSSTSHINGISSTMDSMNSDNDNNNDTVILKKNKIQTKMVAELLVRSFEDGKYLDLRLAVCGNVDSGKSTLIGVLTRGKLDNGRGLARLNVFQHKHEISSGRTSSISHQIMGFDSKGNIVNYSQHDTIDQQIGWREIVDKSSKVVTFIDLAGHERYLKTTVFGMTGHVPDYSLIVVGSNMGVTRMTKEHIGLSLALKLPMIFIVTKIDICPENILKETLDSINKILKLPGVRKLPYIVKNEDDVIAAARNVPSDRICPIFLVSHVTGENLNLLKTFFNIMPLRKDWESLVGKSAEFFIDQTFFVSGVGTVVSGFVNQGTIKLGDTLNLGPDGNGQWRKAQVKGIHVKRNPVKSCFAGQHASFALKKEKRSAIRKGMVMVEEEHPKAIWEFTAEILVLYHSTTISAKYQPVIHTMCVRQSAKIVTIFDKDSLRTGDKAKVKFRFLFRPEYVKVGARLIFREGNTKGLGVITGLIFPENETADNHNVDILPQPPESIINHHHHKNNNNNNNNSQLSVTTSTSSSSNLQTKQEKTPTSANSTASSSSSSSQAIHYDNDRLF